MELTYSQALKELNEIVAKLQSNDCDIDHLRTYTSRALELLRICKANLTDISSELQQLLSQIDEA